MKKKIFVITMMAALALAAAGCGSSQDNGKTSTSSQEPPPQVVAQKELTQEAAHALDMAGLNGSNSTGILHYQGPVAAGQQIKSVTFKLMEYSAKTQKWDCIREFPFEAGESGDIFGSFSSDGKRIQIKVTTSGDNSTEQRTSGIKAIPEMAEAVTETSEQLESVPLELNKDIALHMTVQAKADDDLKSPDLKAYPDTDAYKDYSYIRAVAANFSTEPIEQ